MRKAAALAVLGVVLLGPAAEARGGKQALTAADYAAIYQLYARYAFAFDKAVDNGRMWASLFTVDGTFVDSSGTTVTGPTNLAKYAWDKATRGSFRLITYFSNILIEPSPDGATAKAYYLTMYVGSGQQPTGLAPGGMFFDAIVKTPGGWRFKRRVLVAPDGPVPTKGPAPVPAIATTRAKGAPASGTAGGEKGASPALTAQDYADMEQLSARYAYGNDGGADNGYFLAGAFTPDGFFASSTNRELRGPDQIAAASRESAAGMGPFNTRHWTWNMVMEPAPWGGATGRAYVEVTIAKGPGLPGVIDNGGMYLDTFEKTADGWRFTQRHPVLDWRRPPVAAPAAALERGTPAR